jgi:hypothetical protein
VVWLRVEGLVVFAIASAYYWFVGGSWTLFAVLFFAPDLSFLGYLSGARIGAIVYNLAHTYSTPAMLGLAARFAAAGADDSRVGTVAWALAVIWVAHIGFDRALGYGLKYPTAFQDTHLGRIGR